MAGLSIKAKAVALSVIKALQNLKRYINNHPSMQILDANSQATELVPLLNLLTREYETVSGQVYLGALADQFSGLGDTVSVTVNYLNYALSVATFSATGLPTGVTINATTGTMAGVVAGTTGVYSVVVTAASAQGSATQSFNWTVSI